MRVMLTGRVPAHRFASSTAVVTPANPPPTTRTRGASEVERRARTRPTGRRSIMVLKTPRRGLGFAGSCEGPGEPLTQDHASAVQPRLYRRDRLPEDRGDLLVREAFDIP